jgi:hypothetical protein
MKGNKRSRRKIRGICDPFPIRERAITKLCDDIDLSTMGKDSKRSKRRLKY